MRHKKSITVVMVLSVALFMAGILYAGGFIQPGKDDKCPVCGMFAYKYPKWIAEITFKDGTYAVFDGPKDMFKYYFNMSRYNKKNTVEDISGIYVTEYYTTRQMNAKDVFFITGSDVYGPMGMELVPVKGRKEAETFMKDHKGRKLLSFSDIKESDIPAMKMKKHKGH